MAMFVFYGLLFLVIFIALTSLGIVAGFFLHWIIPGVEIGVGIGTGVMAVGFSLYFLVRLVSSFNAVEENEEAEESLFRSIPTPRRSTRRKKP